MSTQTTAQRRASNSRHRFLTRHRILSMIVAGVGLSLSLSSAPAQAQFCPLPAVNPWCSALQTRDCLATAANETCLPREIMFPSPTSPPTILLCDCFTNVPGCGPVDIQPNPIPPGGYTVSCPGPCPPGQVCELHFNGRAMGRASVDSASLPPNTLVTCACVQEQTGACCLFQDPQTPCVQVTAPVCDNQGRTFRGPGTQCTNPEPCCMFDGTCTMVDPQCCTLLPGMPQGAGAQCTQAEACCFPSGTCRYDIDPLCCDDFGGTLPPPVCPLGNSWCVGLQSLDCQTAGAGESCLPREVTIDPFTGLPIILLCECFSESGCGPVDIMPNMPPQPGYTISCSGLCHIPIIEICQLHFDGRPTGMISVDTSTMLPPYPAMTCACAPPPPVVCPLPANAECAARQSTDCLNTTGECLPKVIRHHIPPPVVAFFPGAGTDMLEPTTGHVTIMNPFGGMMTYYIRESPPNMTQVIRESPGAVGGHREIPMELVAMELVGVAGGGGGGGAVYIRESPTRMSSGRVVGAVSADYDYPADSFFDLFVEIDLPGMGVDGLYNDQPIPLEAPGIMTVPPLGSSFKTPQGWPGVELKDPLGNPTGFVIREVVHELPPPPPPSEWEVIECACIDPGACHVTREFTVDPTCVGGCPRGQECVQRILSIDPNMVDYFCECVPLEACCFVDGSCQNLLPEKCLLIDGTPQGPGTVCLGDQNHNGADDICERECAPTPDALGCVTTFCPVSTETCLPKRMRHHLPQPGFPGAGIDVLSPTTGYVVIRDPTGTEGTYYINPNLEPNITRIQRETASCSANHRELGAEIIETQFVAEGPGGMPVMIRESPTRASSGRVTGPPGCINDYPADSFFDIFVTIDIPGMGIYGLWNPQPIPMAAMGITQLPPLGSAYHSAGGWPGVEMLTAAGDPTGFHIIEVEHVPPPEWEVILCACMDPGDCHVTRELTVDPVCVGGCPGTQVCTQRITIDPIDPNMVDYFCECVQVLDKVVCEPQGGNNPSHPSTYWYDVTPTGFGRCDFHVRVYDPNPGNYTNWSISPYPWPAASWAFLVHQVGTEWWASWWDTDPMCSHAFSVKTRFQFDNANASTWGDWTTTISNTSDPYNQIVDRSANHPGEPNGLGYRVHVPQPPTLCPLPAVNPWCSALQTLDCSSTAPLNETCLPKKVVFGDPNNPIIELCDCFTNVPDCGPVSVVPNATLGYMVSCPGPCPTPQTCQLHFDGAPQGVSSIDSSQIPQGVGVTCACAAQGHTLCPLPTINPECAALQSRDCQSTDPTVECLPKVIRHYIPAVGAAFPSAGTDLLTPTTGYVAVRTPPPNSIIEYYYIRESPPNITQVIRESPTLVGAHREIPMKLVAMNLVGVAGGGGGGGAVMIRESPTRASSGRVTGAAMAADYPADSFFDLFVEVDIPGLGVTGLYNDQAIPLEAHDIKAVPPSTDNIQFPCCPTSSCPQWWCVCCAPSARGFKTPQGWPGVELLDVNGDPTDYVIVEVVHGFPPPPPPPEWEVIECACIDPGACHVTREFTVDPICTGGCPAGTQACTQVITVIDANTVDSSCECLAPGASKWEQQPDVSRPGLHASDGITLADDWQCQGGLVTDLHWWGNYELDRPGGNEVRGAGIQCINLSIHANNPATPWCLPREPALWGVCALFSALNEHDTGLVNSEGGKIYAYDFYLQPGYPQVTGETYWLDIEAQSINPANPALWRWQEAGRVPVPRLCPAAQRTPPPPPFVWSSIMWPPSPFLYSEMAFRITSETPPPTVNDIVWRPTGRCTLTPFGPCTVDADCGATGPCDLWPNNDPEAMTRALKFRVTGLASPTKLDALRVTMVDLMHPDPRNLKQYVPPNYGTFDTLTHGTCAGGDYAGHHCNSNAECLRAIPSGVDGTCSLPGPACTGEGAATNTNDAQGSCARWVGKPGTFYEAQGPPQALPYRASRLQCMPVYWDWKSEPDGGAVTVVGAEILPSSAYSVQAYASTCMDQEVGCTNVSAPVTMYSRRKGDLDELYQTPSPDTLTQANAIDVAQSVNAVKHILGAPSHVRAQMQANLPDLNTDCNVLDIVEVVDSLKRTPYSFSGPCSCPSLVPCGGSQCLTDNECANLYGAGAKCQKECPDGAFCNRDLNCAAGEICGVKKCNGGPNSNQACTGPAQCAGFPCDAFGFCRDNCGRCRP